MYALAEKDSAYNVYFDTVQPAYLGLQMIPQPGNPFTNGTIHW